MIPQLIRFHAFKRRWRRLNLHNSTVPRNVFSSDLVTVGSMSYGPLTVLHWQAANERLTIGSFVSIAHGVKFLLGGNHRHDTLSTFPFARQMLGGPPEAFSKGAIVVGSDVWIGTDCLILSGVTIGQGAVLAAGSVITKDVPPYAIVAGNPARVIKYRFSEGLVSALLTLDFTQIDHTFVESHQEDLCQPLTSQLLAKLIH